MTNFYFQLFIPSDSSTTDQGIERINSTTDQGIERIAVKIPKSSLV